MSSTNYVLYTVEGFMGNSGDYYNSDNSYINRIMVTRMGVHCLPVNFP